MKELNDVIKESGTNFYIWGAGDQGKLFVETYGNTCKVLGFIDSFISNEKETYCGLPFVSPEALKGQEAIVVVAINRKKTADEIGKQLDELGFELNKNYFFFHNRPVKDYDYFSNLPRDQYEKELCEWYQCKTGEKLDLNSPKTYNEKIQWLKLYDSTPEKTKYADKLAAKKIFIEKFGEEYVFPLLGEYQEFDEINFDQLPEQFVLKSSTGSGRNIIVTKKSDLNIPLAKEHFKQWAKENYGLKPGFELHYMNIQPSILVEKYMGDLPHSLVDYRLYCFDGEPKIFWTDIYSDSPNWQRNIYDIEWNLINTAISFPRMEKNVDKPVNLDKMIEFSKILSKDFCHARVDFFEVEEKLYISELTFTNESGVSVFENEEYNIKMGDWLTLPKKTPLPERLY